MTHLDYKVNDKSTAYLKITLYDKDGVPASPSSATYTLLNSDGEVVNSRQDVGIVFSNGVTTITLDHEDNTMTDPLNNSREWRYVDIVAVYGPQDEFHRRFAYQLVSQNL